MAAQGERRETVLIFGEKRRDEDFLYHEALEALNAAGVLTRLITAFSRDAAAKYYVQHAIGEHADAISGLLRRGAHVYLCGNRQYLEHAVATALEQACGAENLWQTLIEQQRLHLELY